MSTPYADSVIAWLLQGEPWIVLRTHLDLLGTSPNATAVRDARAAMLRDGSVSTLCRLVSEAWSDEVVTTHKKADLTYHRAAFLADIGLSVEDASGAALVQTLLERLSPEGVPQVNIRIPTHFGGTGEDAVGWALCDAPSILATVLAMGGPPPQLREQVENGIRHLLSRAGQEGYPCAASSGYGRFRGPGRKEDPCPYATLLMLKLLIQLPADFRTDGPSVGEQMAHCTDALLGLWEASRERHPYLFHMGNDFRRLKAPFVWYDMLHVADTLSQCPGALEDARLHDMIRLMLDQMDPDGRCTPQSVWKAWEGWEFGKKKQTSRRITLLVHRAAIRAGMA